MAMSTDQMRERVAQAYSGENWRKKVYRMSDNQIVAIYYRLLRQGKIQ